MTAITFTIQILTLFLVGWSMAIAYRVLRGTAAYRKEIKALTDRLARLELRVPYTTADWFREQQEKKTDDKHPR